MRIAQIAPLYESVPPQAYGGTERVVSYLTEELVGQGHEVTLFASADSVTQANLVAACSRSLRLDPSCKLDLPHHFRMLEMVAERADEFDVLHFHTDFLHFPIIRRLSVPSVTTLHGRLDLPDLKALYKEYTEVNLISISDSQRLPLADVRFLATVYHGLPKNLYPFTREPGDYFAFIGRISPEKGVDRAIEITKRMGIPLRIAAKVDKMDREYFEEEIRPLLDHPLVEYIGEINDAQKGEFLGRARAVLFPIAWPEPFGMVMIEAMACGTPVIAFRGGSVPEVLDDGVTGFIVEDVKGAVDALQGISHFDRQLCRRTFERRFSADRMARDYLVAYDRLVAGTSPNRARRVAA